VRPVGKAGLLSKKKLKKIQEKEEKAKYREVTYFWITTDLPNYY
jgi:hypothetical protein